MGKQLKKNFNLSQKKNEGYKSNSEDMADDQNNNLDITSIFL